jgi:hypothetical protein
MYVKGVLAAETLDAVEFGESETGARVHDVLAA